MQYVIHEKEIKLKWSKESVPAPTFAERPSFYFRARSENSGGHNAPPRDEIGLTDLLVTALQHGNYIFVHLYNAFVI